jgi:hypothetical protein
MSEEHPWLISGSYANTDTLELTVHVVQNQGIFLILIPSSHILNQGIYNTVDKLRDLPTWNSKARFLVVITDRIRNSSEEIAMRVLKELWETLKVLNSAIVVPSVSLSPEDKGYVPVIDTYTWIPRQSEEQCMELSEVILVNRWYLEMGTNLKSLNDLYANKLPSDFRACPLKVSTPLRNYVWVTNDKNETVLKYDEPEITFLTFVLKKLNFTMIHDRPQPISTDYIRSVQNVMEEVIFDNSDLAIGEIPLLYDTIKYADYTVSYVTQHVVWFVPCGRCESRVTTISRIFSVPVWIMIILLFFIVSILMSCMGAYLNRNKVLESHNFLNVTACLFTLWAVTMGVSASELPRTPKLRSFFILFVWYSVVISTVFQTYFTSSLVDPGLKDRIRDLEGLLKSGLEFGYDPLFDAHISNTTDWRYGEIKERRTECIDRNYCFGRVAITGDFAYLDVDGVKYLNEHRQKSHLACLLDDGRINNALTMYMKKGDVIIDKINDIVTIFKESGLYNKISTDYYYNVAVFGGKNMWFRKIVNETLSPPDDEILTQEDYVPLSLTHLHIALDLTLIGYTLSFFVMMGEILVHKMYF